MGKKGPKVLQQTHRPSIFHAFLPLPQLRARMHGHGNTNIHSYIHTSYLLPPPHIVQPGHHMRQLPRARVRQHLDTPDRGIARDPYIDACSRPRTVRAMPVAISPRSVRLAPVVHGHTLGCGPPHKFVMIRPTTYGRPGQKERKKEDRRVRQNKRAGKVYLLISRACEAEGGNGGSTATPPFMFCLIIDALFRRRL